MKNLPDYAEGYYSCNCMKNLPDYAEGYYICNCMKNLPDLRNVKLRI
jgi:hypothetical protein